MGAALAGDAGGRSPFANARAVYRAWLATAYNGSLPPERHRIFRQVFRRLSGKYPEYLSPISAPLQHRKQRRQGLEPRHHHRRHRAKPDIPTPAMLPTARRFPLATESPI